MAVTKRELLVEVNTKLDGFNRGIANVESKTETFGRNIKRLGVTLAAAFSVRAVLQFGQEVSKLAAEAEGISIAFERIGDQRMLEGLKESVAGTVSEMELMRKTVQAQNLGVPIERLGSLFEFASRRAQETGESVDYLVNSIVIGIGRKSPLILDNLGISAVQLREELKGVGMETASVGDIAEAVGRIAEESMSKVGDRVITTKDEVEALNAEWENMKVNLGGIANNIKTKVLPVLQSTVIALNRITKSQSQLNKELKQEEVAQELDKAKDRIETLTWQYENGTKVNEHYIKRAKELGHTIENMTSEQAAGITVLIDYIDKLGSVTNQLENYNSEQDIGGFIVKRNVFQTVRETTELRKKEVQLKGVNGALQTYINTLLAVEDVKVPPIEIPEKPEAQLRLIPDKEPILSDVDFNQFDVDLERMFAPDTLGYYNKLLQDYNDQLLDAELNSQNYLDIQQDIIDVQKKLGQQVDNTTSSFGQLAIQLATIWASATDDTEGYAEALRKSIKVIIAALAAEGVTRIMLNTIKEGEALGPLALGLAAAAGVAAAGMFDNLVPAFASGGVVPGTQRTGDHILARVNSGEMIINQAQQSKLFNMLASGGMGGRGYPDSIELEVRGTSLKTVLKNTDKYYGVVR